MGNAGRHRHDVDIVIKAITAKLKSKSSVLDHADDNFVIEVYKKGEGYDVKLKTTS